MYGGIEEPFRPTLGVEWDHRRASGELIQKVEQRLHEVVGLHGAAGHVDDWDPSMRLPVAAQVIAEPHRAGWVPGHRVNAAIRGTGPDCDQRPSAASQIIDPLTSGNWLTIIALTERGKVALGLDLLVRNRAFDHHQIRTEFASDGLAEGAQEVLTALLVGEHRVIQIHL